MIQAALLRAVNVGGNAKVPMADLRAMAEKIGLKNARPFPEHWRTAGTFTSSRDFKESRLKRIGRSVIPPLSSSQGASPTAGAPKWLRTKNRSLGVSH